MPDGNRVNGARLELGQAPGEWRDHVAWWDHPALAYAAGLIDGRDAARAEFDAGLTAALAKAFGGDDCTDLGEGIRRHLRVVDQQARRRLADRGELPKRGEAA